MSAKPRSKAKKSAAMGVPPGKKDRPAAQPIRSIGVEEFVRRLRAEASADKRFALFLGAGCSVTSGIPAAGALVKDHWIPRLHGYHASDHENLDAWVKQVIPDYDSANPAGSYGSLIDKLFLWPEERQREIEALCEGRTPAFGYAVLAQLIAMPSAGFNVVLTTNFDDLIADALYLYTDARPLVIHHESLAAYIRPTRTRPLVVKLHGDHRLSPRNTALETESLAQEIQRHTAMVLHDRGIIFMGYGGCDHGILKMLNDLPSEALPFGAYWVHPEEPQGQVREWLAHRQGVWVRSGWFDEVMLLVRNAFDLPHPSPDRFTRIFDEYQQKFKALSTAIQEKPNSQAGVQALKEAVTSAEAVLPDYWKAIFEAERLKKQNPDRAEEIYREGIAQFPGGAPLLGSYALFLHQTRKEYDAAGAMYKRALEADPKDATTIGNYAVFLKNIRKDYDSAEELYKRSLGVDPKNAINVGNYANFLSHIRKNYDAADAMYKRSLEANPKDDAIIGNYAVFLSDVRNDNQAAEAMYRHALEANPKYAINRANWARFLLAQGKADGLAELHQAIELLRENPDSTVEIECAFYLFAHGSPPERVDALRTARKLLESGTRSPGWDFSRNIERARLDGHPDAEWLGKLASVINDEAKPEVLNGWPAWEKAAA